MKMGVGGVEQEHYLRVDGVTENKWMISNWEGVCVLSYWEQFLALTDGQNPTHSKV